MRPDAWPRRETALALLCAKDADSAADLARTLDGYNTQRRQKRNALPKKP